MRLGADEAEHFQWRALSSIVRSSRLQIWDDLQGMNCVQDQDRLESHGKLFPLTTMYLVVLKVRELPTSSSTRTVFEYFPAHRRNLSAWGSIPKIPLPVDCEEMSDCYHFTYCA